MPHRVVFFGIWIGILTSFHSSYGSSLVQKIWKHLDKAEKRIFQNLTNENSNLPKRNQISFEYKPKAFYKESLAYRMHTFCHRYMLHIQKETPSYYKKQIEQLIWEYYYPQVQSFPQREPVFTCYATPISYKQKTFIEFRMDPDLGFYPIHWTYKDGLFILEEHYAIHNKNGIPDKIIKYQKNPHNCPIYGEEDSQQSGQPDVFYYYQNCKLVKWEEDYNLDGIRDRICRVKSQNPLQYECEGIGEKNFQLAKNHKDSNLELARKYYLAGIQELESSFGKSPRHICGAYLELLKISFELENYKESSLFFKEIERNPSCKKEYLEAYLYEGFIQLYKFKNYSLAVQKYEKARELYLEEKFQEPEDINLSLSLAHLQDKNPQKCIQVLDRIPRLGNEKNSYFFHYYKGSCFLEFQNYPQAYHHLNQSLQYATTNQEKAQSYLKLGILYYEQEDYLNEAEQNFQKAIQLNPNHKKFIHEYKNYKTLVAK